MKKIIKPFLFKYKIFPDFNGTLIPFYVNNSFPKKFLLKRFFLLYGKSRHFRADHAHTKCSQIIVPLKGSIKIKITSKSKNKTFFLSVKKNNALFVPPYNWITIFFKNNNDSLLTLCNYKYDKKEYILELDKFKKIISK